MGDDPPLPPMPCSLRRLKTRPVRLGLASTGSLYFRKISWEEMLPIKGLD